MHWSSWVVWGRDHLKGGGKFSSMDVDQERFRFVSLLVVECIFAGLFNTFD